MANVKLPKKFDPVKSAQKRASYIGVYSGDEMARFKASVSTIESDINVKVEFKKDAQGLTFFDGNISCSVELVCQRCNGCFSHQLDLEFCFSPVQGSDSEYEQHPLPDVYEAVEVDDHGEIDLFLLLEDELILSLPIVAMHALEDCDVKDKDLQFGQLQQEHERKNPFAVLKELKRD